jgi:hypothetical protein
VIKNATFFVEGILRVHACGIADHLDRSQNVRSLFFDSEDGFGSVNVCLIR